MTRRRMASSFESVASRRHFRQVETNGHVLEEIRLRRLPLEFVFSILTRNRIFAPHMCKNAGDENVTKYNVVSFSIDERFARSGTPSFFDHGVKRWLESNLRRVINFQAV